MSARVSPTSTTSPRPIASREYDFIAIGSGSGISVLDAWLRAHPGTRGALIEKDTPGGICLTRGCIPSKMLTSVADVARTIERAQEFGISVARTTVHFDLVMARLHAHIDPDIAQIRQGLSHSPDLDFFPTSAEFTAPYTLSLGTGETLHSARILLGLGSEPAMPAIPGLADSHPLTTDQIFGLTELPRRIAILGGGYIAAEFGHFFASMGSDVTVIGRNPRFLPREDPEVSATVERALGRRVRLLLGRSVPRVVPGGRKGHSIEVARGPGAATERVDADIILVATGRVSTAYRLKPERGGVATDSHGWITVNEYLETSQPGIWALGDATGGAQFKHRANHDTLVLYRNLVGGEHRPVDYHAVPHAVFSEPEVGAVGLTEPEAIERFGAEALLVGRYEYRKTAKGEAIGAEDGFVKVIVDAKETTILGAHVVGPQASILVQEVVNLLYTPSRSARPILDGMHIHPALSEVVERAFLQLAPIHAHSGGHVHATPGR
ncbi:MAG: dihydrolipoyl dehydrogenase [Thermoplasmata archaeon]